MTFFLDRPGIPVIRDDAIGLQNEILNRKKQKSFLIAIDGVDGSGKSSISKTLALGINATHLALDKFLRQDTGVFVEALDFNRLQIAITEAGSDGNKLVIVDGVCVLAALERLKLNPDFLVYVRRRAKSGIYGDDSYFGTDEDAARKRLNLLDHAQGKPYLSLEILDYHRLHRPFDQADVLYDRIEN